MAALAVAVPVRGQVDPGGEAAGGAGGVGVPPGAMAEERAGPIVVDGRLAESTWWQAVPITGFVQGEPIEGAPAEQPTEVRVLFDGEAIYVGARLFDDRPSRIGRQLVRRDDRGAFDYFVVSLDPNDDNRTGYQFQVSAAGVQRDAYLYDDTREDESWDAVWESAVSVDGRGWAVEMRIPLSQIRYEPSDGEQTWGVNFERRRLASNERTYFALESRRTHGKVSRFAALHGIRIPESARRLEVRPYALARAHMGPSDPGDPFFDGSAGEAGMGADVRYGIGTAFNLDLTVNPDFGQVEVDPAVINLSAFETFFPEKRPFFVEDARVFDFNLSGRQNSLFYSRRIGREPHGSDTGGAAHTDVPDQTTILGAAKFTGRTSNGLSVGALASVTAAERGEAYYAGEDRYESFAVEPRSYYGVFRAQKDFNDGASAIGGIVTGMARELLADGTFDVLPRDAYSAGLDFEHSWANRTWALTGFVAGSLVRGSEEAMIGIQESSNHYYQRPDATRLAVDSSATSLAGAEWRLEFEKRSGRHWTGGVWLTERTSGFDVNDLGYFRGSERLDGGARVSYQQIEPGTLFRDYRISLWTYHNWRHEALDDAWSLDSWGRAHKAGMISLGTRATFLNYWGANVDVRYRPEVYADDLTRGGPLMTDPARWSLGIRGNTDRRRAVTVEPNLDYSTGDGGTSVRTGLEFSFRPAPRLEIDIEPGYDVSNDYAQYVSTTDDLGYAPTYGNRYLFGDLHRRTLSLETRLSLAFTPTLTFQLFAQPLMSSGEYLRYKALEASATFAFDYLEETSASASGGDVRCDRAFGRGVACLHDGTQYVDFDGDGVPDHSFGDRDFNVVSLRGNAVLRWEYRPGSTIFLVWQQRRYDNRGFGDFELGRDAGDMLALEPDNILILKVNYWLGL